ncbi:MAG: alpha/beta hydrolase [Chloroflexi bacterium]|nr:alpha/beta hydrolase [Chloroflexota bacterium]
MIKRIVAAVLLAVFVLTGTVAQEAADDIILVPFTDFNYTFTGVVPSSWVQVTAGLWSRESGAQVLMAQQARTEAPDVVLVSLLPQFGIDTVPEPVEIRDANGLTWAIYEILAPAGSDAAIDVAITGQGTLTYFIILASVVEEHDALKQAVFLPAVDGLVPLSSADVLPEDTPYTAEDVSFTAADGTELSGTLTLPEGDGPHPVVVLVSSSGPHDRDGALVGVTEDETQLISGSFPMFAVLSDHLTRAGFAVLRYDERGVGRSRGDHDQATTGDFAVDASAALDALLARDDIDSAQVGLIAHGEGANAAAIILSSRNDIAFVVALAPQAVDGLQSILHQTERVYQADGEDAAAIAEQLDFLGRFFPRVAAGDTAGARTELELLIREQAAELTQEQLEQMGVTDIDVFIREVANVQFLSFDGPWWPFLLNYDPSTDWSIVTVPVLALFGELDTQIDPALHRPAFEAAMARARNLDVTVETLPAANHLFQLAATGSPSEYTLLQPRFVDGFLDAVTDWLLEHAELP